MGDTNRDSRGRFAAGSGSAAAAGDHQAASPSPATRNVEGQNVPRSQPVTAHAGMPSVGTGFAIRVRAKGPRLDTSGARDPQQTTRGLGKTARERVALNESADRSHYPDNAADVKTRFKHRTQGI